MLKTNKAKKKIYQVQFIFPYKEKLLELTNPIESYLITNKHKINLLTGKKVRVSSRFLAKELSKKPLFSSQNYHVTHLFYEAAGFISEELAFAQVKKELPLAIFMSFKGCQSFSFKKHSLSSCDFSIVSPSKQSYSQKFNECQKHLYRGDSYQINLTERFKLKAKGVCSGLDILSRLWSSPLNRGAYGSFSYIELYDWSLISNSPECLFQTKKISSDIEIEAMPIKGTVSLRDKTFLQAKKELFKSEKDRNELFMITDLLRNDLYRVTEKPVSVTHKRALLQVPGLLHQYSKIQSIFSSKKALSLQDVLASMFPGGSVTGAPKISTMKIIQKLETEPRGFYCGTTVIQGPKMTTSASINIRSGEFCGQKLEFVYGAGGGITVKSSQKGEFSEMQNKFLSFLNLF